MTKRKQIKVSLSKVLGDQYNDQAIPQVWSYLDTHLWNRLSDEIYWSLAFLVHRECLTGNEYD